MKKQRFHQGWTVEAGDDSALSALFGEKIVPMPVTLPHDHSVEIPRNQKEPNGPGNGYFHEENLVYRTLLSCDEQSAGKRVYLEFEGVYQNAFVYVNDALAGKCAYGYSNFYLDITSLVTFDRPNAVKVIVRNGVPSGRWYTGGGIYRNVNLMLAEPTHIAPDGVFVFSSDIETDLACVTAKVEVANEVMRPRHVVLKLEIFDNCGNRVAEAQRPVTLKENEHSVYELRTFVKAPKLWDEETPNLYTFRALLIEKDRILDEEDGSFGIRKLQLDPVHGLRVNGKTVKLRGGCIHHDNGIIGTREFPLAAEQRVVKLKEAGFNAIRSAHYPMSRQLLEACDRYGLYVMDEYADVWTTCKVAFDYGLHMTEWWEHDIDNLVRKDRNHPCVIMYSIGNEIPETGNAMDAAWGKQFADRIRSLDPTRYTVNAINLVLACMSRLSEATGSPDQATLGSGEINTLMSSMGDSMDRLLQSPTLARLTEEAASQVDIVGYNYALGRYMPEGSEYPNRIIVGSETNPPDLDVNWEMVKKLPYVIGDFDWTAWDYLGEVGIGAVGYGEAIGPMGMMYAPYPFKAAYCGDLNLLGDRRPVSYWREIIWGRRTKPYIAVQSPAHYGEKKVMSQWAFSDARRSWSFSDWVRKPIVVEVYGDVDEIELRINGKSVGRKMPGEVKRALTVFDTIYEPGVVEAIAYRNGAETARDRLETAGDVAALSIKITMPGEALPSDGSDIAYIDVFTVDAQGHLNTECDMRVTVSIEGPGRIIGFGSASPCNEENYYDTVARPYEGKLRAAVRACGEGIIRVCFSSGTLKVEAELPAKNLK